MSRLDGLIWTMSSPETPSPALLAPSDAALLDDLRAAVLAWQQAQRRGAPRSELLEAERRLREVRCR